MNFQPINTLQSHSLSIVDIENSEYNKCGGTYLTSFDKDFVPNFYVLLEDEIVIGNGFSLFHINIDGTVANVQIILDTDYIKIPTSQGIYYFFNNILSSFGAEGIYQLTLGYTDSSDFTDYFEIFDTYKFINTADQCHHKITFSNECNIDGLPIERLNNFEFYFYTSSESSFGRLVPIFEPEFETNIKGEDIATYKRMFIQETFRMFNLNENLLNTIFYASIYDNFEITLGGEIKDKVFRVEFAEPVYQGESCCIFYLDITLIREYKTNNGCCDDVIYADCQEFDSISIDSIRDDAYEPVADNGKCYLIRDDIANPGTPWTPHLEEVACGDGLGGWTYSQPTYIYNESNGGYLKFDGVSYVNWFFGFASATQTFMSDVLNFVGSSDEPYIVEILISDDGGSTYTVFNTISSTQLVNGYSQQIPSSNQDRSYNFKYNFILTGCNTLENVQEFSVNLMPTPGSIM